MIFGANVIYRQKQLLRKGLGRLKLEGFRYSFVLKTQEEVDSVQVVRTPLWTNCKSIFFHPHVTVISLDDDQYELRSLLNAILGIMRKHNPNKRYGCIHDCVMSSASCWVSLWRLPRQGNFSVAFLYSSSLRRNDSGTWFSISYRAPHCTVSNNFLE